MDVIGIQLTHMKHAIKNVAAVISRSLFFFQAEECGCSPAVAAWIHELSMKLCCTSVEHVISLLSSRDTGFIYCSLEYVCT